MSPGNDAKEEITVRNRGPLFKKNFNLKLICNEYL